MSVSKFPSCEKLTLIKPFSLMTTFVRISSETRAPIDIYILVADIDYITCCLLKAFTARINIKLTID